MERMAKLLDVSTSGYYGWFSRPESEREQERLLLDVLVKAACEASRGRYGSLKISRALGRHKESRIGATAWPFRCVVRASGRRYVGSSW